MFSKDCCNKDGYILDEKVLQNIFVGVSGMAGISIDFLQKICTTEGCSQVGLSIIVGRKNH